ncbi:hypothetical protein [Paucisalibacillus sp. EB02]|uniref:hypothetical protein n=1 Tax=Paucisalibacillus sp. EB02 TaxID=1347087 RepID=UPI0004B0A932|nr:hypothetical protein [Paucisalibacillus sp. EB02]
MEDWWKRKKEKTRKHRKLDDRYTFGDFLMGVLFWVPEIILIPFRTLFWALRGVWRFLDFT